jgi:hypothetical protein
LTLSYDDWTARLALHPQAKGLAASLLWRVIDPVGMGLGGEGVTVLPVIEHGRLTLRDVSGAPVSAGPDSRIALWRPSDATAAERGAWRDRLVALQIRQPFKQAFREHYAPPFHELSKTATAMFAGHVVSINPFLGLARRERWSLEYDSLTRSFRQWTATFDVADRIYPGCVGATTTGNISLWLSSGGKSRPARLADLPPATLSEILRSVDLLVSVSGFAVETEEAQPGRDSRLQLLAQGPLGAMAEMRKQALERVLRGLNGMEAAQFDARHLRLGPYAIHLATGRITRDGEPVTIDPPERSNLAAVPWLPYDEKLLGAIVHAALEIARRLKSNDSEA